MGPWSTIPTRGGTRVSGKGWRNSCCKIIIMGKRYYYDERTWLTSNKQKAKSWGWEAIAPLLPPPPPPLMCRPWSYLCFAGEFLHTVEDAGLAAGARVAPGGPDEEPRERGAAGGQLLGIGEVLGSSAPVLALRRLNCQNQKQIEWKLFEIELLTL